MAKYKVTVSRAYYKVATVEVEAINDLDAVDKVLYSDAMDEALASTSLDGGDDEVLNCEESNG